MLRLPPEPDESQRFGVRQGMENERALDHLDDSRRFDMREQIVRQIIANALAVVHERNLDWWLDTTARDVLVWLDNYDADATQRAWEAGFRQGVTFGEFKRDMREAP